MSEWKQYKRTNVAEMRPYILGEILSPSVSISSADRSNGSPKSGDMIARNPQNHSDQWLVSASYFEANFETQNEETKLLNDLRGILDTVEPSANMVGLRDDPLEILELLKDYVERAEAAFNAIDNILNVEFPDWAKPEWSYEEGGEG